VVSVLCLSFKVKVNGLFGSLVVVVFFLSVYAFNLFYGLNMFML